MASQVWNAGTVSNISVCEACVSGFVEVKNRSGGVLDYAFVVEVEWADGRSTVLKRTYSDFQKLRQKLCDSLPAACKKKLPLVPGKKLFQRNCRELAEKREVILNVFIRGIVRQPPPVSSSPILVSFLESRRTDPKRASSAPDDTDVYEHLTWDGMADLKPEEDEPPGFSYCYDEPAENDDDDDIDWSLDKSQRDHQDYDSGHESSSSRCGSQSHLPGDPSTPSTDPSVSAELCALTLDSQLHEEEIKLRVNMNDITKRSSVYYNLYAEDTKETEHTDKSDNSQPDVVHSHRDLCTQDSGLPTDDVRLSDVISGDVKLNDVISASTSDLGSSTTESVEV